jgi:MFS transporter, UMF1 family
MNQQTAPPGKILSWTLFDFANTSFYVIIITVIFPVYFKDAIAGGNEAYWGRTIAASMLITALLGPLFGSIADATSRKKFFLGLFTAACVAATAGLYLIEPSAGDAVDIGALYAAIILLIIANVGFEGGTVFYDAFLPELASEKDYGKVSGYGFAMGYLGSFVTLLLALQILGDPPTALGTRQTFLLAAGGFALFSLPLFLFVREEKKAGAITTGLFSAGYRRLRQTLTHLREYDAVKRFLLAYFIYNDGILTVIAFAAIFASKTLGMDQKEQVMFFLLVQGTALLGSLLFGALTNRIGARQGIAITLLIWIGVVVAAYFVDTKSGFFVIGGVAGIGLGSSQSTSRALMALLTPLEKKTEFFGFYDGFFGKASAIIGPLLFGEVAAAYGQRPAMLVVGAMFIIGIALVMRVPDVRAGNR